MKRLIATVVWILAFSGFIAFGQSTYNSETLVWNKTLHASSDYFQFNLSNADGYQKYDGVYYPIKHIRIPLTNERTRVRLKIKSTQEKSINTSLNSNHFSQFVTYSKGKPILNVEFIPVAIKGRSAQLISAYTLEQYIDNGVQVKTQKLRKADFFTNQSVLSTGDWFKFSITAEGMYKLTGQMLASSGMNISGVDANTIKVYGFPGGNRPEAIDDINTDDLVELALELVDANGNNRLDETDFLRFYAQSPNKWIRNGNRYKLDKNLYSEKAYLFVTSGGNTHKTVATKPSGQGNSFDATIDHFYHLIHNEKEETNFIQSGRYWFGDAFNSKRTQTFTHIVSNVYTDSQAYFSHRVAGRIIQSSGNLSLSINGVSKFSGFISGVNGAYDDRFGRLLSGSGEFTPSSTNTLNYTFVNNGSEGNAWIDYYTLGIPVSLNIQGNQVIARSHEASYYNAVKYKFSGSGYRIWDVTDYANCAQQSVYSGDQGDECIVSTSNEAVHFALFNPGNEWSPEFVGKVSNQNLHGLQPFDFVIITHNQFKSQADQLAQFHRDEYSQSVQVVLVNDIYNEFSGGRQDPVAMREFIRMLYKRGQSSGNELKYVLMFGDGSYDYFNRIDNNTNFVPTFQSREVVVPENSYSSDDFYAILDDGEGLYDQTLKREDIDLGIGRIPCRNSTQAQTAVNKILHYHDPITFGDWQNRVTFLGDDEDLNRHFLDTETVSGYIKDQSPVYNITKIYLDAYEQQSFGSGEKYPDVNKAITEAFEKGHLVFNYLGHGGTSGMAHERVVTRDEIRSWNNYNQLALMVTATCELSRFDDPAQDSPGELMLFNQNGGAIGLVTTMRLVLISLNTQISKELWDNNILSMAETRKLGDIFTETKNSSSRAINLRNFSLLADPAMELAIPDYEVFTTKINGVNAGSASQDTFKAFSKIKIDGVVRKPNGDLASNFNGFVYPTVFDKYLNYQTLGNDENESDPLPYTMQNSVLYRGKVSVTNGEFSFQFVVPKDISYNYGKGKISYFAENGQIDARGMDTSTVIGGSETNLADDNTGPDIDLFLNDETWVFGGTTDPNPLMLVKVYDENGINTVGNGIGRDLTAIIDAGTENEEIIVLNDFYQSKLDSYQEGEIRYPLEDIAPGRHTLKVRVWDVYNNSSEDETEFIVAEDADLALNHVLNFPNPFTTSTVFHFDHNKPGQQLDVHLQILTPSGRIVKSFFTSLNGAEAHFDDFEWDGKDEFGDRLARGVYLYKVTAKAEDGTMADVTQKLVILK